MGIVAGLLAQNVMKYLLDFGEVSYFLSYNSFCDFFPKMVLQPSPNCGDSNCVKRQEEFNKGVFKSRVQVIKKVEVESKNKDDNEWGIVVESSSEGTEVTQVKAEETEDSLDDLKAKMMKLQTKK